MSMMYVEWCALTAHVMTLVHWCRARVAFELLISVFLNSQRLVAFALLLRLTQAECIFLSDIIHVVD